MLIADTSVILDRTTLRATIAGVARAAYGAEPMRYAMLCAAMSRLVGKQTGDPDGFERIVEAANRLDMLGISLAPSDVPGIEGNKQSDADRASEQLEDELLDALTEFGA